MLRESRTFASPPLLHLRLPSIAFLLPGPGQAMPEAVAPLLSPVHPPISRVWRTILRTEGLVFTVPRRGTYVSPDAK